MQREGKSRLIDMIPLRRRPRFQYTFHLKSSVIQSGLNQSPGPASLAVGPDLGHPPVMTMRPDINAFIRALGRQAKKLAIDCRGRRAALLEYSKESRPDIKEDFCFRLQSHSQRLQKNGRECLEVGQQ